MAGDLRFTDSLAITTMTIDIFEKYGKLDDFFKRRLYNRKVSMSIIRFGQIRPEFKEIFFDEMQKNFGYWVSDNEFYEYLMSIMIPRNRFLLESILNSETAQELEYLIENYDLESEINKISKYEKLNKEKNQILIENEKLSKRNEELIEINENLENINKEHLNSKSWKITKPLRAFNKIFKDDEKI